MHLQLAQGGTEWVDECIKDVNHILQPSWEPNLNPLSTCASIWISVLDVTLQHHHAPNEGFMFVILHWSLREFVLAVPTLFGFIYLHKFYYFMFQ